MSQTQRGSLVKDDNDYPSMGGTSYVDNETIINSAYDPVTRRLLVDLSGGGGGGLTVGTTTVTGATNGYILYNNNGVLGAEAGSGVGTVTSVGSSDSSITVTNPTTTPNLIVATAPAGSLTGTTLKSTVTGSSLTSVGTVATGTWNATPITGTYLNLNGNISAGTNVTLTGTGTSGSPYVINSSGGGGTAVYNETETVAGSGTTFTLAHTPVTGTVRLYRGGSRQQLGVDYTMSGGTGTFTPAADPSGTEVFIADYIY
jgi:hypothetical protein